ncbi:RapZ C-terminal domain-containing protein [Streptomyces lunaelactis]|uniref:RapZ C-terminal domain-containing protein n=1 Tax=Streptomyces lunaelactis TaxID=1535768 RepID=UPI0020C8199A|nr:RNase adapter RapZ [Streptomyces lunaelactis]
MPTITITSFGTGHTDAPWSARPVVVDTKSLRNPPEDPDVRRRMTQLTGLDRDVAHYVMTTPGAERLVEAALLAVYDRLIADQAADVDVHVSCTGGRHRSVAVSEELASRLRVLDAVTADVQVVHRHIGRPVLFPSDIRRNSNGYYWVVSHPETGTAARFSEKAVAHLLDDMHKCMAGAWMWRFRPLVSRAFVSVPEPITFAPQDAVEMARALRQIATTPHLYRETLRELPALLAAHADRAAAAGEAWTWDKEVTA